MIPVRNIGSLAVRLSQSAAGREAIACGEGLRLVHRLSTQLQPDPHIAAAMVLSEMCADLRCERALVEEGGVEALLQMLLLAESFEQHAMRWVVEAVRHAAHEEANLLRASLMENMEEIWPILFKLLNHEDATLRAHSGATVASMFIHGGARLMETLTPLQS